MAILRVLKLGRQGEGEKRDGAKMKGLTVENLSIGILSEYSHSLCRLVPRPPHFYFIFWLLLLFLFLLLLLFCLFVLRFAFSTIHISGRVKPPPGTLST